MDRRHDLDWLRILLFALLVPHHAAVGFVGFGRDIYGFVNDELGGPLLALGIYFSHSWRLPSLFFIAGVGTYFATSRGIGARFLGSRLARLLVPALFGTFVLNVGYGYAIAVVRGEAPPFLAFWRDWLLAPEPRQVGHLWFLYNLAFYTLACWPLYALRGRLERTRLAAPRLLAALIGAVTLVVVAAMPFGKALAGDGYQLPWYLAIFAAGYVIGARHRDVLDWAARRAFALLGAAAAVFAVLVIVLARAYARDPALGAALAEGGWAPAGLAAAFTAETILSSTLKGVNAWLWCLAATGLVARYLNRDGTLLRALRPAVFPVYVLHFPVTIIGLALLLAVPWPWQAKFVVLTLAVYAVTWALYRLAARGGRLVYLVGGKPARVARQRPA
ncbi:MAG: acyltransferase family protein [Burkholderiales bacterium]|nr:acyltransferase family protein [Burkholderiales bacterium]